MEGKIDQVEDEDEDDDMDMDMEERIGKKRKVGEPENE